MSFPHVFTIGAYGFDDATFFHRLTESEIEVFCDVRARRGVRGSQYAFVNSRRLQGRLDELGLRYVHRKDLAPSQEVRQAQWDADAAAGIGKRSRTRLGEAFVSEYEKQTLSGFDAARFLEEVAGDARSIVLFCVETEAGACHRSLLTDAIQAQLGISAEHLMP